MVTHNPELTRYASRVVFMHDGGILADEQSAIGEVPDAARSMYFMPRTTREDDLAGVSALMQAIPDKPVQKKDSKKKKTKTKTFRARAKTPKKRGKR
jgi:ABC-type sulfate/molybdate transport systems ATPase subunit